MHGVDLEAAKATSLEKRVGHSKNCTKLFILFFLLQVPFLELSGLLEDQFLADMDIPDSLKSDSTDTKSPSGFVKSPLFDFSLRNPGFRLLVSQLNH